MLAATVIVDETGESFTGFAPVSSFDVLIKSLEEKFNIVNMQDETIHLFEQNIRHKTIHVQIKTPTQNFSLN